jgi:hypothetical protein
MFKSIAAELAILSASTYSASASVGETVNMTFLTGATFAGSVTFADDFSSIFAVNGVLTGYQFGDPTYSPSFSDPINTVNSTFPPLTAPREFGTYLFDGPDLSASHFIVFTYDYSGAPVLAFTSDGNGNSVDFIDPFVSGSISPAAATPLPPAWTMLLLGMAGLGLMLGRSPGRVRLRIVLPF